MYETILVATDGSEGAAAAATHAADLAETYGATVHVLYVVDVRVSPVTERMDREDVLAFVEQSDEDPIAPVRDRLERADVPVVEAIRHGLPHEMIGEYADEYDVDLIVMGTHGRSGLDHTLLGSVTERVLRTVDVPVLAVHRED